MLFDGGTAPLAVFGDELSRRATAELKSLGVEMHMGSIVTNVDGNGVVARDHDGNETRSDAGTVLWTAGVEAPPIAEALAKATGADRDRQAESWSRTISPSRVIRRSRLSAT